MFCFVFSSLETNAYEVITSLDGNASASANHSTFSTDFTYCGKELVKLQVLGEEPGKQMPLSYTKEGKV